MSERLSDSELAELTSISDSFLPSRGIDLYWRALSELKGRRAADLSSEELKWGTTMMQSSRLNLLSTLYLSLLVGDGRSLQTERGTIRLEWLGLPPSRIGALSQSIFHGHTLSTALRSIPSVLIETPIVPRYEVIYSKGDKIWE